jgi:hypothetical protein
VLAAVRGVTGRLVAVFGLVLSLVLAALALYVGRSERASILASLDDDLATVSALLANQAPASAILAHDRRTLDAWADRNGRTLGRRVTVIAADGEVLGDSEVPLDSLSRMQNHADRPEVVAAKKAGGGGLGRDVRTSATLGVESFHRRAEKPKINVGRPANHRATEHRVARNDVVPDARMDGERHAVAKGVGHNGGFFPRVFHMDASAEEFVVHHGAQQFGAGRRQRMGGFLAQRFFQ